MTTEAALDVLQMRLKNQSRGGVQTTRHLPYDSRCSGPEKRLKSPRNKPRPGEAATENPSPVGAFKTALDSPLAPGPPQMAPRSKGAHSPPATLSSGPAPQAILPLAMDP